MSDTHGPLVWLDLEMTGLDINKHRIIEIATIVTDSDLNIIEEGPSLVIHQDTQVMADMDEWCILQHERTGLTKRVQDSTISVKQAEEETLAFLSKHTKRNASLLCGNSICTDRRFLYEYMPTLESFLHYRMIDVSTVKELARRWAPTVFEGIQKSNTHLALADIRESIDELRYYRQHFVIM